MKIGLVYTSTTKELEELVEAEVKKQFEAATQLYTLKDATILKEIAEAGYVTAPAAARLISMYMKAVSEDCDAVLNICSSVGETADAVQDVSKYIGVPIVRIDEEMCREAVRRGKRIGIMATLPTTLSPTRNTVLRMSRECKKPVEVVECLVEGGFGKSPEEFKNMLAFYARTIKDKVDVIVLAQGSMAYCETFLEGLCKKPVLSSPRFGAVELKKALQKTGCIGKNSEEKIC